MHVWARLMTALAILAKTMISACAGHVVRFEEDAPKDRFVVTNKGGWTFGCGVLVIDLATSPRGLLFDTVRGGAGENVAQPLEIALAENLDVTIAPISDSSQSAKVSFSGFPPHAQS